MENRGRTVPERGRSASSVIKRFDLGAGFLLTTKKLHLRSIIHELLWFLSLDTHVAPLQANKVRIWNEWATAEQTARFGRKEGDLGPVYGHQWRNFGATVGSDGSYADDGVDQIQGVLDSILNNPFSRRIIVTGWNPKEANQVALPPCHTLSSTSRRASSVAGSTSGARTSSSAYPSTSRATACWS